eukprot:COSAG01_NODE_815_length_13388_cov_9.880211_4_plen_214_part_00
MADGTTSWKASGWLGIVTAGMLWTPLIGDEFEASIDQIVQQIRAVIPPEILEDSDSDADSDADVDADTDTDGTVHPGYSSVGAARPLTASMDTKAELERLRSELMATSTKRVKPVGSDQHLFDAHGLAAVPTQVPELPRNYRSTEAIRKLRLHLTTDESLTKVKRVGFFGMGGIVSCPGPIRNLCDVSLDPWHKCLKTCSAAGEDRHIVCRHS